MNFQVGNQGGLTQIAVIGLTHKAEGHVTGEYRCRSCWPKNVSVKGKGAGLIEIFFFLKKKKSEGEFHILGSDDSKCVCFQGQCLWLTCRSPVVTRCAICVVMSLQMEIL